MKVKPISGIKQDLLKAIEAFCNTCETDTAAAAKLGVNKNYLSKILNYHQTPSVDQMLSMLASANVKVTLKVEI